MMSYTKGRGAGKKLVALLLTALLVVSLFPQMAFANEGDAASGIIEESEAANLEDNFAGSSEESSEVANIGVEFEDAELIEDGSGTIAAKGGERLQSYAFVIEPGTATSILMQDPITDPVATDNFLGMSGVARGNVKSLSFTDSLPTDADGGTLYDVSSAKDGSVKALVTGNSSSGFTVIIGANGGVKANNNSRALFRYLTGLTAFDMTHFDTTSTTNMSYMFRSTALPADTVFPAGFGSAATDMSYMFVGVTFPGNLTLPAGFGSSALNLNYSFYQAIIKDGFTFPAGFGSSATAMRYMFNYASIETDLAFPEGFGASTTDMYGLFAIVNPIGALSFPEGFGAKATSLEFMFYQTDISKGVTFPEGFGLKATSMVSMFRGGKVPANLTFPAGFGSNATNMEGVFHGVVLPANLTFPAGFGSKATRTVNFFYGATIPEGIVLPEGFGVVATDIDQMFWNVDIPAGFSFPEGFGSQAINMTFMFSGYVSDRLANLPAFPEGFGSKAIDMTNMFYNGILPEGMVFPEGFGSKTTTMQSMFYNAKLPEGLTFPEEFGAKATNMIEMFWGVEITADFHLPKGFGSEATNMSYMFSANEPRPVNLKSVPDGFGSKATTTRSMFYYSKLPENLTFPEGFGAKSTDMGYMFRSAVLPEGITFPTGFGAKATDMVYMFYDATLQDLILPSGFGSEAIDMSYMFSGNDYNRPMNLRYLPEGFGSKATDMRSMFYWAVLPETLVLPAGFGSETLNMGYMFYCTKLPRKLTLPEGFASKATDISYMFDGAKLSGNIDWSKTAFENLFDLQSRDIFSRTNFDGYKVYVMDNETVDVFNNPNVTLKPADIDSTPVGFVKTGDPAQLDYAIGDLFNPTGFNVMVEYENGIQRLTDDFEISKTGPLTASDNKITITVTAGDLTESYTYDIKVFADPLMEVVTASKGIDVSMSSVGNYPWRFDSVNNRLQTTGMGIHGVGSILTVNINSPVDFALSFDYASSAEGSGRIVRDYLNVLINNGSATTYIATTFGDQTEGAVLATTHSNTYPAGNYTLSFEYWKDLQIISTPDLAYVSNIVVKSLAEPVATGIVKVSDPTSLSYKEGDEFDITGFEAVLEYDDGSQTPIDDVSVSIEGPLTLSDTQVAITVVSGEFTETYNYDITVSERVGAPASGDIDGDGGITITDVISLISVINGTESFTDAQYAAADIDGDSDITMMDIILILRMIAGI